MCFSFTASLATGAALTGVGIATLNQTKHRTEIPLALFPLLFGIQQLIESIVWLSFTWKSLPLNKLATCGFTFFSHIFWPIFVPFAVALMEQDERRKKILKGFQIIGIIIGIYLLFVSLESPIASSLANSRIVYDAGLFYKFTVAGFYITIVCGSFFVASDRLLNAFGFLLMTSFLIAYYFYAFAFVSVWCFFAAVLSIVIYLFFKHRKDFRGVSKN